MAEQEQIDTGRRLPAVCHTAPRRPPEVLRHVEPATVARLAPDTACPGLCPRPIVRSVEGGGLWRL